MAMNYTEEDLDLARCIIDQQGISLNNLYGWDTSSNKREIALFAKLYARVRKQVFRANRPVPKIWSARITSASREWNAWRIVGPVMASFPQGVNARSNPSKSSRFKIVLILTIRMLENGRKAWRKIAEDARVNIEYILDSTPCAVRVCEGGGLEDVNASLAVTWIRLLADHHELKSIKGRGQRGKAATA